MHQLWALLVFFFKQRTLNMIDQIKQFFKCLFFNITNNIQLLYQNYTKIFAYCLNSLQVSLSNQPQKMHQLKTKNPNSKKQQETQQIFQGKEMVQIYNEFVQDVIKQFEESRKPEYYVYNEEQEKLKNNLISNSVIIYGPADSGKTAYVYWAIHQQPQVEAIIINCELYSTQSQFINKMVKEIGSRINQKDIKMSLVVKQAIKFEELNEFIINSGKKFVFVIKCCQKLVIYKKQIILYNLCEWMKTSINGYVGVVFLSKKFDFTQKLQKRVKSRMAAKKITLFKPDGQKILEIFKKRMEILGQKYQDVIQNNKSKKKKLDCPTYHFQVKTKFLQKLYKGIFQSKEFKTQLQDNYWKLNNQYLQCLKLVIIKDMTCNDFLESVQNDFNQLLLKSFQESRQFIYPNYYHNIILQCGIPELILLGIVANIGINSRGVLKLSQIYKWFLEFQKRQPIIVTFFGKDSKKILQRNLQLLVDKRLFELQKKEAIWQCQIFLAITPSDIGQILKQKKSMQTFIGNIVDL